MRSRAEVPDHRSRQGQRQRLTTLLVVVCTGMLWGCQSLQALTAWGKRQEKALVVALGSGYGTLQRQGKVDALEKALYGWAAEVLKAPGKGQQLAELAMDGKVLRGSRQGDLPGVHVLSVVAQELGARCRPPVTKPKRGYLCWRD